MIRFKSSKQRKYVAFAIGFGAFVSLNSALSAKDMGTPVISSTAPVVSDYPVQNMGAQFNKASGFKVQKTSYAPRQETLRTLQTGVASYYGPGFHGRKTANGERFNMNDMTAAHKTLPFGTRLKVTNLASGQSAIVRVNDRGPYSGGRVLDLSVAAAKQVGVIGRGTAKVKLEVVEN